MTPSRALYLRATLSALDGSNTHADAEPGEGRTRRSHRPRWRTLASSRRRDGVEQRGWGCWPLRRT